MIFNNSLNSILCRLLLPLLVLSFVIDGVKITSGGQFGIYIKNSYFLTELFCIIFIFATIILALQGRLRMSSRLEYKFFVTFSVILILLTVIFSLNFDADQIFGKGNFRSISIIISFGVCLICLPFNQRGINIIISTIIFISIVNSVYNICLFSGVVSPLDSFKYGYRGGESRYSGFSNFPSHISVLCAAACGAVLPYCFGHRMRNCLISICIFLMCASGIITSMSRSGLVGLVICSLFFILISGKRAIYGMTIGLIVGVMLFAVFMPKDTNRDFVLATEADSQRPASYVSSVIISIYQPWGVPMGSFGALEKKYNPGNMSELGEPHSGVAQLLIYGGVISAILYCILNLEVLMRFLYRSRKLSRTTKSCYLAYIGTCGCFLFEQGLYMKVVLFFHILLLSLAIKSYSLRER